MQPEVITAASRATALLLLGVGLCLPRTGLAECPASASQVDALTKAALGAYTDTPARFTETRDMAVEALGCVTDPVTPGTAAAYHRMEALAAFMRQDDATVRSSFRASLALQPSTLSTSIASEGHPLRILFDEAQADAPPTGVPFVAPEGMVLVVDGTEGAQRPIGVPFVLEVQDTSGLIVWSGYVLPGEKLPPVAIAESKPAPEPLDIPEPREPETRSKKKHKGRVSLAVGSGLALAAGAGLAYAGWDKRRAVFEFEEAGLSVSQSNCEGIDAEENPEQRSICFDRLGDLETSTVLYWSAGAAGTVGLGLGVGAVFVWTW